MACRYTANLAAFLTVSTLNAGVTSIRDLHGKLVVTIPIYPERIWRNHGLRTTSELGAARASPLPRVGPDSRWAL